MPKKLKRKTLVKKLDTVFSQYVRLSSADKNGMCTCVTCGRQYFWKKIQAGHFMSRRHYSTRWDEDNVKSQCYSCNCMMHGKQYEFSKYLGKKKSEYLLAKSRKTVKFTDIELLTKIEHYSNLLKSFIL